MCSEVTLLIICWLGLERMGWADVIYMWAEAAGVW